MTFHTAIARLREASYAAPSAGEGPNTCLVGRHDLRTALHVIDRLDADLRRVGVISHGAVTEPAPTAPIPAGWKPISSAPKDGTPVLAFWTGATEAATVYGRSYGITMFKHGEWVNVDNCDDAYSEPTHWMPLPAAPQGAGAC